jgi:glyoxylase-like metal-dependent hydrolase (beta-lactamase superfamily II)
MSTDKSAAATLSIQRFTSSEAGGWSNSYLISGTSDAILFDVFMLPSDAVLLAKTIESSGKTLKAVMISHAHPDHFMGLDALIERLPKTRVLSARNVIADIKADGSWMLSLLQSKLGSEAPKRLVVPEPFNKASFDIGGTELDIVEFGEGESKHLASLYIPSLKALLSADLVNNNAHLYLAEKHMESWLERLDEIESFAKERVSNIYPGHGPAGGLSLIERTREYLNDFAKAVKGGDEKAAEQLILAKYPEYHARQFLTVFSIPAYFRSQSASAA